MPEKFLVGGEWRASDEVLPVKFPYDGTVAGEVYMATPQDLDDAMEKAVRGFEITRRLPSYKRSEILQNLHCLMQDDKRSERNLAYVASLVGVPLEIDPATLHRPASARVRLGCRNVDKIPMIAEAVLGGHFYDLYYEVE
jgi:hypothetical protein